MPHRSDSYKEKHVDRTGPDILKTDFQFYRKHMLNNLYHYDFGTSLHKKIIST